MARLGARWENVRFGFDRDGLGVTRTGEKRLLGLIQTATENKRVGATFLRELEERGFRAPAGLLVVIDGSKGLRAAVREVFGDVPVQRCQWHKRENVVSYLPKQEQPAWRRKLQAAYAHQARDARQMRVDLQERVVQFGLQLHDEKTRVIEFGRLPAIARKQRGERRLGTFAFLGFTHYCGWTRDGRFVVKRKTQRQRVTKKLSALNDEAKRRRHEPVRDQHRWLCQVLRGHYAYFGLPSNFRALQAFAHHVRRIWFRALYRRSQRRLTGAAFEALLDRFPLPKPRITHPCLT